MCNYCEKEKTIMDENFVDDWIFNLCKEVKSKNINYSNYKIFIDRGYLRFVDVDDCQCMDHGKSIKISYCPFCGIKIC